jgi:hypothetical protein
LVQQNPVAHRDATEGLIMPWGAVQLKPGVDTQLSPAANQAGVTQAQLIRYKEGLLQTYGGWTAFANFTIGSTVRELHPWQDIAGVQHLGVGATQNLTVITAGSNQDITPQTNTTNPAPNFSISSGSNIVTIVDAGSSASIFNTVYFNTPIAIGNLLLNGAYPINSVGGSSVYTILSSVAASTTIASSGILPVFSTSSGSATITVTLPNNGYQAIVGLFQQFIAPTIVGSSFPLTVQGKYQIASVIDSTSFKINSPTLASTTATATMNGGNAEFVYYITLGPPQSGFGFGGQAFGGTSSNALATGFGGTGLSVGAAGTPITTTDWTMDNWGEVLLCCPKDGPIYAWAPDFGFQTAQVINQAPFFSGGIFVSMPQQILVAWRSVQASGVQDPLLVRWSNAVDYTNWAVTNLTTAGSFHIPTGSQIIGGIQCPQFGLISTDVDVWTMTFVAGSVVVFSFNRIGSGCGWIGPHACGILANIPFWMSTNNFFTLGPNGTTPIPCTVWDQVFQNLSAPNQAKVRCGVNSAFNEVAWFFPSLNGEGENDSYAKVHIEGNESFEWDYGSLSRTAWCDISVLGMPLGVDVFGQIFQHETGTAITGAGLSSFRTGWWVIAEGEEKAFIDFISPDFVWGQRSGPQTASIAITFFTVDYPGDTPTSYGPYVVTQGTEFINVRMRGRLMSAFVQSNATSEFWRLGRIRFRYGVSGRR